MNRTPVILPAADSELARLVESICDGTIMPVERDRLESLLTDDQEAKLYYVAYLDMHAQMQWIARGEEQGVIDSPAIDVSVGTAVELPQQLDLESQIPNPPFPALSTTNYPLPTSHFSVGSWAFSYMVATVIMGVTILGFWAVEVTHHQHIAEAPAQSAPSDARPEMEFVGRITGMVNVKWSDDPHYLPPLGFAHVPLGRKYILSSGLLEITYDSGAKVILQGPCTYEVESTAGGYLSLGKLTARVEKRGGKGSRSKVQGSRSKAEPSSFILHPLSLFSVRTPVVTVTDLGTEFGVEVREDGLSEFQVFQGAVEAVALHDGKPIGRPRKLVEGQVARVSRDGGASSPSAEITVAAKRADPKGYVRTMPAWLSCTHQLGAVGALAAAGDDLIDAGQPTLAKIELTSGEAGWESSVPKLNDGDVYHGESCGNSDAAFVAPDGAVVTVTFNTGLHPAGYDIKSIVLLTGSGGKLSNQDRSSQRYDVAYSTVDDPDVFILLRCDKDATVDRFAHGWTEMQATLTRAKNIPIARGVAKLRFVFHNTSSADPESMYREIDVFGLPTNNSLTPNEGR